MFIRMSRGRGDVPAWALVPNLLTTLALCSGLASLHFVLAEQWEKALAAIVMSGIFDVLDGAAARLLKVSSKFGAVLDSLSDFLAFGVAPAMILHQWILRPPTVKLIDTMGLAAVTTFALCSALRLARFTAAIGAPAAPSSPTHRSRASLFFVGMPTPAGAGAALVPAFLAAANVTTWRPPEWAVATYIFVIAILMVSRVPMFALKGLRISRRMVAPVLVVVGLLGILMVREPWMTLMGIALCYLATIPWAWVMKRRHRAREHAAPDVVGQVG